MYNALCKGAVFGSPCKIAEYRGGVALRKVVLSFCLFVFVIAFPIGYAEAAGSGFASNNLVLLRRFEEAHATQEALVQRMTELRSEEALDAEASAGDEVYGADYAVDDHTPPGTEDGEGAQDEYYGYDEHEGQHQGGQYSLPYQYIEGAGGLSPEDIADMLAGFGMVLVSEDTADEEDYPEYIQDVQGFGLRLPRTETTFDLSRIISGTAPSGTTVFIEVFGYDEAGGFVAISEIAPVQVGGSQGFARMIDLPLGRSFVLVTAINGDDGSQEAAVINRLSVEVRRELEGLLISGFGL